jgi:DNA repair exonuclease SbcCD ATPase subunit
MIHVRHLYLQGVSVHEDSHITLPDNGVVLVTGSNGSGKSSLVEGVGTAGWNKTLRGAPLWRDGRNGQVGIDTGELAITRTRTKGGKTSLSFEGPAAALMGSTTAYETTGKGQEALERLIGEFDVWRRTSVFSSQDASHFTLATDAERKHLLEVLLNLQRFDAACELCRKDLHEAEKVLYDAQHVLTLAQGRENGFRQNAEEVAIELAKANAAQASPADAKGLAAQCQAIQDVLEAVREDLDLVGSAFDSCRDELAAKRQEVDGLRKDAASVKGGTCRSCGQVIPGDSARYGELEVELQQAEDKLHALSQADSRYRKKHTQLVNARDEETDNLRKLNQLRQDIDRRAELIAGIDARYQTAVKRLANAQDEVLDAQLVFNTSEERHDVLAAAAAALGLRGIRAQVLGAALAGIEQVATTWLGRIMPYASITLQAHTETKAGKVNDTISLAIGGVGGGAGYPGCSGGERRRIDIALMLALSEVAAAAVGKTPGTLFFDEVFDALDPAGIDAVSEVLTDLARDRAVIVIAHNEQVIERLHPTCHIHIHGGKVTQTGFLGPAVEAERILANKLPSEAA